MKYLILLSLNFFTYFFSDAQEAFQFKCFLKSSCTNNIVELKEYTLRKQGFFFSSLNGGSTAILPDTGCYVLESSIIATEGDSLVIYIGIGINIDTVKKKDLVDVVFIDSKPLKGMSQGGGWLYCNKPCSGYTIDYYNNGKKMVEGKFKKGKPVGNLKFYNANGKLTYIEYYNKRGKKIRSEQVKN
jgi:hypothetical protein